MLHNDNKPNTDNQALRLVTEYLKIEGIQYFTSGDDDDSDDVMIMAPICFADIPALIVKVFVTKLGKVSIMAKLGSANTDEKKKRLYPVLNSLNSQYSFVCFSISDNDGIYSELQFIASDNSSVGLVDEYFGAFFSITERAATKILQELWNEPEITVQETEDFDIDDTLEGDTYDEYGDEDEDEYSDEGCYDDDSHFIIEDPDFEFEDEEVVTDDAADLFTDDEDESDSDDTDE